MNKLAYCEMYGRELAVRAFVNSQSKNLEKQANADDQEVNTAAVQQVSGLVDDLAYREKQQKLAFQNGVYRTLDEFETAIKEGADADAILDQVKEAKQGLSKEAMAPEDENEDQEMFDRMQKGASDMYCFLTGQEPTDEIKEAARDLVASQFAQQDA